MALFMARSIKWLKHKRHCARGPLFLGFVLPAGMALAQNLVTNPGFEAGDTTGWFAFGPPTISAQTNQVHSGKYAGLVTNRTATWNGIAQSLQEFSRRARHTMLRRGSSW